MEANTNFRPNVPGPSGNNPMLKKLTTDDIAKLLETLEKMRASGIDQTDPRFIAIYKLLRAHGVALPALDSEQRTVNSNNNNSKEMSAMSGQQMFQLKAQVLAYKYLSRNQPIPPKLLSALRGTSLKQQHTQYLVESRDTIQLKTSPITMPSSQNNNIFTDNQASVEGINVGFLFKEREKRVKTRIQHRVEELLSTPADIPFDIKRRAIIELKQYKLLEFQKKLRGQITDKLRKTIEMEGSVDPTVFRRTSRRNIIRDSAATTKNTLLSKLPTVNQEQIKVQKHAEFIAAVLKHSRDFKDHHQNKIKKLQKKINKEVLSYYTNEQKRLQLEEERKQRARLQALRENDEQAYLKLLTDAKNSRLATLLKQTDEYLDKISSMLQLQKDYDEIEERKKLKEKSKNKKKEDTNKKDAAATTTKSTTAESNNNNNNNNNNNSDQPVVAKTETGEYVTIEKNKKYYTSAHAIQEEVVQPDMLTGKLKSYQLTGLQWLVSLYNNRLNGILADEMGLGKTIQTISLISYLMEKKGVAGPYLIVVPLSTMSNWTLEFAKWAPSINVVIFKGKPQTRKQIFKDQIAKSMFNVCLTSYEYIMIDKSDLAKIEWKYIIIDEGHRIKNKNSKLSSILRQYMSRHRILLTGTPLQNDLGELWALLNFLLPNIFNSSDNFEQWFNAPFAFANKKGKAEAAALMPNEEEQLLIINRLHKVLRPFLLRRLKKDVEHELPEKIETVLKCDLSALQKKMYKHMVESGILLHDPSTIKAGKKNAKGFNNIITQLQKICNHPYLFNNEWLIDEDLIRASGKFDLIDRILPKLHKAGHRVLIFNQMTQLMTIMEEYFQYKGHSYLRLDGSTKAEERSEMVKIWNDPKSPYWLFMLSTKAGGLGLNLQTADTVIIFDTDWNPMMDLQAQDRVHRIGQTKTVRVFRLISQNTVEERILERANYKLDVDAKVIQAGMFNTQANDAMRKQMLEELLRDQEEDKEELELITSDQQINSLLARDEDEYTLYQQIDVEREKKEKEEWKQKGKKGPRPARLMQEDELPEWIKVEAPVFEDDIENYGRGLRQRKEVVPGLAKMEGMSDSQFVKLLEEGEAAEQNKRRKKKSYSELSDEDDNSKEDSDQDSMSTTTTTTTTTSSSSSSNKKEQLLEKFQTIWETLEKEVDSQGRKLSTVFIKLPSKRDMPQYYRVIKQPISMTQIKTRFGQYRSEQEFKEDFHRMFLNAQTFNQQDSLVYQDSVALQNLFNSEFKSHFGHL